MRYFPLLAFALLIVSCTPKLISPKQEAKTLPEKEVQPDTVPSRSQPVSPCKSLTDLSGADRERAETAYVLYKDFLKTGNYEIAYEHWKTAYTLAPASNGRVKYHFEDGASIYKHFFQKTTDARLKKLYVDTIMQIYDKKKECFGDEAYINGLKAFDYYYYFPEYASKDSIFALFTTHMDVKKTNADYFVINPFARILTDFLLEGKVDVVRGRNYVRQIQQSIINGKATCKGKQCDAWVVVDEYAPIVLESLEGIDGFFDCEYYASKYYALYTSSPDSCDVINLAMARMGRGGCTDTDARFSEVKKAKNDKCFVAPPPLSCAAQGNEEYGKGNYSKAVDAYFQCVESASDAEQKAKYLLLIAKIYYRDLKNYPRARKIALDAAKMKPGWGEPYLLIGNLYASSGPLCGTGRGWESQVVTWPAIDMWMKARTVDSKSNAEATALINRYKQYMPKKEDIFFRNIKAGETYFVSCWIQENTSVRTSD